MMQWGFWRRRQMFGDFGLGHYFTRQDIDRFNSIQTLIQRYAWGRCMHPNILVDGQRWGGSGGYAGGPLVPVIAPTRGQQSGQAAQPQMTGSPFAGPGYDFSVPVADADIEDIEIYGAFRFPGLPSCTVEIWLK